MKYTFVGTHQESLASGRPLFVGDVIDESVLVAEDDRLKPLLIEVPDPAPAPVAFPPAPEAPAPTTTEAT